jgi:hypothetical protein
MLSETDKIYKWAQRQYPDLDIKIGDLRFGAYFRGEKSEQGGIWYESKLIFSKQDLEKRFGKEKFKKIYEENIRTC